MGGVITSMGLGGLWYIVWVGLYFFLITSMELWVWCGTPLDDVVANIALPFAQLCQVHWWTTVNPQ